MPSRKLRSRSATEVPSSASPRVKRRKTQTQNKFQQNTADIAIPQLQPALLLHAIRQPYKLSEEHAIPEVQDDHELLVKVVAAGLNPIDWKAP